MEPPEPDDDPGAEAGGCSCDELPLLLLDPVPFELLDEPPPTDPAEPLDPLEPLELEPAEPLEWLAEVEWAGPGSALAIPRAPAALTTPTPTVRADSRAIPRLRSSIAADLGGWAG